MKRALLILAVLLSLPTLAQAQISPGTTRTVQGGANLPAACSPVFNNVFLKSGSGAGLYECLSANTWTKVQSGTFSGQISGAATPTDCTAPSYSFTGFLTSGLAHGGSGSVRLCAPSGQSVLVNVNGGDRVNIGSAAMTLTDSLTLSWSDVVLSRGAANRLDLASGDSFYVVSGGLGVGVAPPAAGQIQTAAGLTVAGNQAINFLARAFLTSPADGKFSMATNNATDGILVEQFTNNPTCATNCGTSPTLSGVDSSFTLTMGASGSPASGFVVTFNGTWAAAPQCTASMGLTGMVVGKLPLTVVTTTTTITVVTNGTAPANSDVYHFRCSLGQ